MKTYEDIHEETTHDQPPARNTREVKGHIKRHMIRHKEAGCTCLTPQNAPMLRHTETS